MVLISDCQHSTPGQQSYSATSAEIAKGKRKATCDPEAVPLPRTPPPSKAKPRIYLQSSPHNAAVRYSPKLAHRMQRDTCFNCHKQGHWAFDCPLKSPKTVEIYCRCGHGFCEVRTANTERNKGRKYYVCPIKRGKKCSKWIKWCDDPVSESDLRPPPYKYPECGGCHAGVCRKVKEVNGPNAGRCYFTCPVPEEHGNCGFRLWEDDVLNTANVVPVRQSCQKTLHYFWEPTAVNSEKRQHDETTGLSTPTKSFSSPHLEIDDDLSDEVLSLVPLEEIIENNAKELRITSPSVVRRLDTEVDERSLDAPDSPLGILSKDGCSIPDMTDTSPCAEIEMLEQPIGKNEATSSQEELRELKLEVKGLKEMVTALVSLMPSHLSNVPTNGVLGAALQQAPLPPALQMHDSHLSRSSPHYSPQEGN